MRFRRVKEASTDKPLLFVSSDIGFVVKWLKTAYRYTGVVEFKIEDGVGYFYLDSAKIAGVIADCTSERANPCQCS